MKRLTKFFLAVLLSVSLPAWAEQSVIQPQTQGDVTYVSGGVGADEKDAMEMMRRDYNLHLLFVQGRGEYLSGVKVQIVDAGGHILLDVLSDGPMVFVNLKPGRYTVSAEVDGRVFDKKVNVGGKKLGDVTFLWPK